MIFRIILLCSIAVGSFSVSANAQTAADDDDIQSWNDIQLTVKLAKNFDFTTRLSGRFDKDLTRFSESRYQMGVIWKPSKALAISPFFLYANARNAAGKFQIENRLNLAVTYKFPVKGFGLSHRSLFEYRMRRNGNSWRYRPSITIDKPIPKRVLKDSNIFFTVEPFYSSTTGRFNRNRLTIGISRTINKSLTLDVYYLRQNDGYVRPGDLNVLGATWKINL